MFLSVFGAGGITTGDVPSAVSYIFNPVTLSLAVGSYMAFQPSCAPVKGINLAGYFAAVSKLKNRCMGRKKLSAVPQYPHIDIEANRESFPAKASVGGTAL